MDISAAVLHGLVWSVIWGLPVTLMEVWWPQLWVHDYPKVLQAVITLPPLTGARKTAAHTFRAVWLLVVLGYVFFSVWRTYGAAPVGYWAVYLHVLVMNLLWNLVDTVVLDWGIFCTWRPRFIVLPGSEGHPAYRDYGYHLVALLKGCAISVAGAAVLAGLCYGAMAWLVWR